jgi:hypothetical protein
MNMKIDLTFRDDRTNTTKKFKIGSLLGKDRETKSIIKILMYYMGIENSNDIGSAGPIQCVDIEMDPQFSNIEESLKKDLPKFEFIGMLLYVLSWFGFSDIGELLLTEVFLGNPYYKRIVSEKLGGTSSTVTRTISRARDAFGNLKKDTREDNPTQRDIFENLIEDRIIFYKVWNGIHIVKYDGPLGTLDVRDFIDKKGLLEYVLGYVNSSRQDPGLRVERLSYLVERKWEDLLPILERADDVKTEDDLLNFIFDSPEGWENDLYFYDNIKRLSRLYQLDTYMDNPHIIIDKEKLFKFLTEDFKFLRTLDYTYPDGGVYTLAYTAYEIYWAGSL